MLCEVLIRKRLYKSNAALTYMRIYAGASQKVTSISEEKGADIFHPSS